MKLFSAKKPQLLREPPQFRIDRKEINRNSVLTIMKDFLKNYKIPLILSGCALVAIIVTLVVITGGSSSYGLYISSASGIVSVTNSDETINSSVGDILQNGSIITVGEDASCTVAYKGRKNSEDNYLVIGENSQLVVSSDFDGKDDGELFLRRGSVIGNFAGEDRYSIKIRTADSLISTDKSVFKISYFTNEFMSYTDLYTFMGDNNIQLYDALGNPVNNAETQIEKMWGRIVSEDGPSFDALNLGFDLNELSAFDLKNLIAISAIVGEKLPYSAEELKAAYDLKAEEEPDETTDTTAETTGTDNSDSIQTAEPIVTDVPAPTETTLPGYTTAAPVTTTAAAITTAPPQTETTQTASNADAYHTVTIIVDGEETIQEIAHGESAVQPEDPDIEGLTFIGWDGSFENITEDRVITAMFKETMSDETTSIYNENPHTVTVVIGNRSRTITVNHGESADLPNMLDIEGYIFKGWDKDFTNITSDITITAILEPAIHNVTFVIGSDSFTVKVDHNGSVLPPYIPTADSNGNRFVGWDKALDNIIMDTTITAVFADDNYHTVTFIIDGEFYTVHVPDGETATPPFWPITNSAGGRFIGWDKSLENITSDVTITAYYE